MSAYHKRPAKRARLSCEGRSASFCLVESGVGRAKTSRSPFHPSRNVLIHAAEPKLSTLFRSVMVSLGGKMQLECVASPVIDSHIIEQPKPSRSSSRCSSRSRSGCQDRHNSRRSRSCRSRSRSRSRYGCGHRSCSKSRCTSNTRRHQDKRIQSSCAENAFAVDGHIACVRRRVPCRNS